MAKSRKMSSSLKSAGDAWRAHVANVAKTEGVKYGKAMSLASKGKYGAEWKKIKAGLGSSKKGGSHHHHHMPSAGGGMAMSPAPVSQSGGDPDPYNEVNGAPVSAKEGFAANSAPALQGGKRRRTKKARKGRGKRGGLALIV